MLVGLKGGAQSRSVWDAICDYGRQRLEELSTGHSAAEPVPFEDRARGVTVVLEICVQFFDTAFEDLFGLAATQGRKTTADGESVPLSWALGAEWLLRGLVPCAALFPFQCLVGSRIIEGFREETVRLGRWCRDERLAGGRELREASGRMKQVSRELSRHRAIQRQLEPPPIDFAVLANRRHVDGRFRIAAVDGQRLTVTMPGHPPFENVVVPVALADIYEPGLEVCLAIAESVGGWVPLASTIPVRPRRIEREIDGWARRLGRHILRDSSRHAPEGAPAAAALSGLGSGS